MVDVVGLRFVTEGEQDVVAALKRYTSAQADVSNAALGTVGAIDRMNSTIRQIKGAFDTGIITNANYRESLREIKRQYAELSGTSIQKASAEVERFLRVMQQDIDARAFETARRGFESLAASLDPALNAVQQYQHGLQVLTAAQEANAVSAREVASVQARLKAQLDATLDAPRTQAAAAFDQLRASIDPTVAASLKLAAAQKTVDTAIEQGVISAQEGASTLQAYTKALNDTSKANELMQMKTEMLARAYNPLMAATMVYERQVEQLNEAHRLGVLTGDQLEAQLQQLQAAYSRVGASAVSAQSFVNQFGEVTRIAGVSTNRFGMVAQQVGYQVGDFFVQVQSGTNVFVAFGQQATQLAGLLPGLVGAIVGIGIAIGTTLLAAWDRTRQAAKDTGDGIRDLEERFRSLQTTIEDFERARVALARGITPEELVATENLDAMVARLQEAQAEVDRVQQAMNLGTIVPHAGAGVAVAEGVLGLFGADAQSQLDAANAKLQEAQDAVDALRDKIAIEQTEAYERALVPLEQQLQLLEEQRRFGEDSLQARNLEHRQALTNYAAEIEAQIRSHELSREQGEALIAANAARAEASILLENQQIIEQGLNDSRALGVTLLKNIVARVRETVDAESARNIAAQQRIAQYEQETALNQAILQFGAESAEVEAVRRAQAMAAVEAYIRQNQLTEDVANNLRDAAGAAYDTGVAVSGISTELGMAVTQAQNLASALNAAAAAGVARQERIAVLRAQIAAAQTGANADVAGTRAQEEFRLGQTGMEDFLVRAGGAIAASEAQTVAALTEQLTALTAGTGGTAAAGGAAQQLVTLESITREIMTQISQERELLGLSGQARREREIALEIEAQLRQANVVASEEAIQATAREIAAQEALVTAMREHQQMVEGLANTMSTAFGDAFMAIVDGTKTAEEAFKDMARAIIAELYNVLVVQQMVSGISGVLSGVFAPTAKAPGVSPGLKVQAMGNAFMGGNVIPFANGGVVGSPTLFPMSRGNTGLMGEAGPEAIMPLKRGRDGKLGVQAEGGGNVTVNNNFTVAANGDESVKRIVAQQIPAIARATEAAVIDARQRGGKMRATFR